MKPDRCCFNFKANHNVFLAMLLIVAMLQGCASVSKVVEKTKDIANPFKSSGTSLKKKVGIAGVQNISQTRDSDLIKNLGDLVAENLTQKCNDVAFVFPQTDESVKFLDSPEKKASGDLDNLYLAGKGREIGLNGIGFVTITGIHQEDARKGFMWFKKSRTSVELIIRVEVYDTYTGAKTLYETLDRKVEIGSDDVALFDDGKPSAIASINEALEDISEAIGKVICKSVEETPWEGFVINVDGNKVEISSGSEAGIKVGDEFIVSEIYGTVKGIDGHQYRIPGGAIDEIKITGVTAGRAEGVTVSGKSVPKDSLIRLKEK